MSKALVNPSILFESDDSSVPSNKITYLLHLEKISIPGVKVTRLPSIEKTKNSKGTFYHIKYFIKGNPKFSRMIRVTSRDPKFKFIYSIDLCNNKLQPEFGMVLSKEIPESAMIKFLQGLSKFPAITKNDITYKSVAHESILHEGIDTHKIRLMLSQFVGIGLPIIMGLLSVVILISYYIKLFIKWRTEVHAETNVEKQINNSLFSEQTGKESAFSMYDKIVRYLNLIIKGRANAVILYGPPGMSKTYIVRRTLHFANKKPGKDYTIEKGSTLGINDVYQMLYDNRDKILIFDDFDTPLKNAEIVNMLKAITDTYNKRILSMPREKFMSSDSQHQIDYTVPEKFEFKGKIIIITNLDRKDIDKALLSRAPAVEVNFNPKQIIDNIEKMLKYTQPNVPMEIKKEVLTFIKQLYRKNSKANINFRTFTTAIDARIGDPQNWKEMVTIMVL